MDKLKAEATATLIATRYIGEKKDDKVVNKADVAPVDTHLARGIAGRPMESTPALIGAKRGHVTCDTNVDSLAYWNEPQGNRDSTFITPFGDNQSSSKAKYLVFTPDKVRHFLFKTFIIILV